MLKHTRKDTTFTKKTNNNVYQNACDLPAFYIRNKNKIYNFLKSLKTTTCFQSKQTFSVRKPQRYTVSIKNSLLHILICLFLVFRLTHAQQQIRTKYARVKEYEYNATLNELQYCYVPEESYPIDLNNICDQQKSYTNKNKESLNKWLSRNMEKIFTRYSATDDNRKFNMKSLSGTVLTKSTHKVHGNAWQCKMEHRKRTWRTTFWGEQYFTDIVNSILLTSADCENMKLTKYCGNKPNGNYMSCIGDKCEYRKHPKSKYSWFNNPVDEYYFCSFGPKSISVFDENSLVFNHKCKAKDLQCVLDDSIVIWKKDIIHECPFYNVTYTTFNVTGDLLTDDVNKLALQYNGVEHKCGTELITTTQGVYLDLTKNDLKKYSLEKFSQDGDIKGFEDLNFADSDYKYVQTWKETKYAEKLACNNFVTQLKIFRNQQNKYIKTQNHNGQDLVLYATNNQVYRATCTPIERIWITENVLECYEAIKIRFYLNSYVKFGYLTADKIITSNSCIVECQKTLTYVQLNNITIAAKNKKQEVIEHEKINFDHIYYFEKQRNNLNLAHMEQLADTFDLMGRQVSNFQQQTWDTEGEYALVKQDVYSAQTALEAVGKGVSKVKQYFDETFSAIGFWLLCALVILTIIVALIMYCYYINPMIKSLYSKRSKLTNSSQLNNVEIGSNPTNDTNRNLVDNMVTKTSQNITNKLSSSIKKTKNSKANNAKLKWRTSTSYLLNEFRKNLSLKSKKNNNSQMVISSPLVTTMENYSNSRTFFNSDNDQIELKNVTPINERLEFIDENPYCVPSEILRTVDSFRSSSKVTSSEARQTCTTLASETLVEKANMIETEIKNKYDNVINEYKEKYAVISSHTEII